MKVGILLVIIGFVLIIYLSKVRLKKQFLNNLGIAFGILFLLYGLILSVQPDEYIQFTKTTISQENNITKK